MESISSTEMNATTDVFLQWKGTDACMDVGCECGWYGHFDGYFAYAWKCRGCGAVYEMTSHPAFHRNDTFQGIVVEPSQ